MTVPTWGISGQVAPPLYGHFIPPLPTSTLAELKSIKGFSMSALKWLQHMPCIVTIDAHSLSILEGTSLKSIVRRVVPALIVPRPSPSYCWLPASLSSFGLQTHPPQGLRSHQQWNRNQVRSRWAQPRSVTTVKVLLPNNVTQRHLSAGFQLIILEGDARVDQLLPQHQARNSIRVSPD